MQGGWSGGNGREGGRRPGGGSGPSARGTSGQARGTSGQGGASGQGGNAAGARRPAAGDRWSNELDAVLERAPKETTAPKNDDERNFFEERTEIKSHSLSCPDCRQTADYALTWLVRRKRERPAGFADEAAQARFEKAGSYMVRREDSVACQNVRCRKRFEIVGLQTVAFLENAAKGSVEDRAARVRAAFTGRARG